jgi:glycosyltransferase involved in cell wall biosynthesis
VTDGSATALAGAIDRLLGDAALRARMGAAGRAAVDAQLSLDAFGAHLEALYRSLLD